MHFIPDDFIRRLDFLGRGRDFADSMALNKTNLVKSAFLSIHASAVESNLRNSSQSAQPTETEGRRIMSEFFLSEFFLANVLCLNLFKFSSLVNS